MGAISWLVPVSSGSRGVSWSGAVSGECVSLGDTGDLSSSEVAPRGTRDGVSNLAGLCASAGHTSVPSVCGEVSCLV